MPIYCNDNTLLCVGDSMVEGYKDYINKAGLKEMSSEDCLEEVYMKDCIGHLESLLDDFEQGASIDEEGMQDLYHCRNILNKLSRRVVEQLKPSHLK